MKLGTIRLTGGARLVLRKRGCNLIDPVGLDDVVRTGRSSLGVSVILQVATQEDESEAVWAVGAAVVLLCGRGPGERRAVSVILTQWKGVTLMWAAGVGRLQRRRLPVRRCERACLIGLHT